MFAAYYKKILLLLLFFFIAVGITRIVSTYNIFTQTTDEPAHIACGLEWLDHGTYTYEPHHPPLSRIACALGPYLAGTRLTKAQSEYIDQLPADLSKRYHWNWYYHNLRKAMWDTGHDILYNSDSYFRTLSLARMGNLPFFIFATFLIWYWSRKSFNDVTAIVAVAIFTTIPPVLAHAGLATTDMAITATFLFCIIAFTKWLEQPNRRNSIIFGIAGGLAIISKFSSLLFFPVSALAILFWRWFLIKRNNASTEELNIFTLKRFRQLGLAALAAFLVIWSVYQFSVGPIKAEEERPHEIIDKTLGSEGFLHDFAYAVIEAPIVPAPELFAGIKQVSQHNERGHPCYLLGEVKKTGWWYFFPVALSVKLPIPILILIIIGFIITLFQSLKSNNWLIFTPALCASATLLAAMFSNINIGLRHILPIIPFLSIIAAYGAISLWNTQTHKYWIRMAVIALGFWQLYSTASAHPDYLSYFNEFASGRPEKFIIDSDLDWGQDLQRLSNYLKEKGIKEISIAYQGTADITKHNLPVTHVIEPYQRATGWIAASIFKIKVREGYAWLENYKPKALIGKSIRLYYIPDEDTHATTDDKNSQP